jgi:hypothetical protein
MCGSRKREKMCKIPHEVGSKNSKNRWNCEQSTNLGASFKFTTYSAQSTNSLILFGITRNYLINGRSLLLYQFTKTDRNNYRGISLLSTSYNILLNILLSRLVPYIDEIIGDHQCGFRRNRSTTEQIFCIRQILEKKMGVQWDRTSAIHRLQEKPMIQWVREESIVQYSHRVWGIHETRQVD